MDERAYLRTHLLVPEATRKLRVLVVGAGMVGSWTTAALARMVGHVTVVDYDTIEEANVGVQLYTPADVGQTKIEALIAQCAGLPVTGVEAVIPVGEWAIEPADVAECGQSVWMNYDFDVVVSAIDSMAGREHVAMQYYEQDRANRLFVDVRVMGEMVCVLTYSIGRTPLLQEEADYRRYLKTIQPDDAVEEVDCGAEGTVYSGMFAAQRVAAVVNNWGRGVTPASKEVWNVAFMQQLDAPQEVQHGSEEEGGGEEEITDHLEEILSLSREQVEAIDKANDESGY